MEKTVLITGGSGLIGRALTDNLLAKSYRVYHLSRSNSRTTNKVKTFHWDVSKRQIEESCIDGVQHIIHLAGEGIASKVWTNKRKQEIIASRTESIRLLYDLLSRRGHIVRSVISASGVGYYGNRGNELLTEESTAGKGFLANSCIEWEKAVDEGKQQQLRVVKLRTGVVLSREGGALPSMAKPIKLGLGAPLGSGRQWMPWIHIRDIVEMYSFALENEALEGVFNAAAPQPVTNADLTKTIARVLEKPVLLPSVPALVLRVIMGEMSSVVLNSTRTSSKKIKDEGFTFKFPELTSALRDIYAP